MSVQSEINRLKQAISDAFTAVSNKGCTVPASKTSGNLASAIESIPVPQIKTKSGTFTIGSDGNFGADVGEEIVCLCIYDTAAPNDFVSYVAGQVGARGAMFSDRLGGFLQMWLGAEGTTFGGSATRFNWSFEQSSAAGIELTYTAYYVE